MCCLDVQNVQGCDATVPNSNTTAGHQKKPTPEKQKHK